jgi:hypothetical protein
VATPRRGIVALIAIAAVGWLAPLAMADEGPTLGAGDTAAVRGTSIRCVIPTHLIRCSSPAVTVTLSSAGKVEVMDGRRRLFPRSTSGVAPQHLRMGNAEGFFVGATKIFCHVYVTTSKTLSCYTSDPKGGLAGTYGFDLTDKAVVVFRFGNAQDRHTVNTFH